MKKYLVPVFLISIFFATSENAVAQEDADFRMEIGGGLGTSFYLGDLNSKFYHDVGPAVGVVWRYLFNPRRTFKTSLTYGGVKGESDVSHQFLPPDPHGIGTAEQPLVYSFSSHVVDFSAMYEVNFWPYGFYQDYLGYKRLTPFFQLGLGLTYMGASKKMTVNLPLGAGIKYRLARRLNVALDWMIHFTLSDDVDNLNAPMGIKGQGIKNKDSYQMTMVTLTYNFSPICPNCNKDR